MERAIFISNIDNLKYVDSKYSRLYFGNEFCQRLIPSLEDLKKAAEFILKKRMDFTLVTPYVTDEGLEVLRPIAEFVARNLPEAEFVINDWGVLRILRKEFDFLKFVLGRLLTKQKRGPRILSLKDKIFPDTIRHFKGSNIDVPELSEFLMNNGIVRVELDNLLQGIDRENPSLRASLYIPYNYVTTTRYCLTAGCVTGENHLRSISNCNKECQKYTFRLRHKKMPVDLLLKGNTQFFKNNSLPSNLEKLNIDRIVYQPEIPI